MLVTGPSGGLVESDKFRQSPCLLLLSLCEDGWRSSPVWKDGVQALEKPAEQSCSPLGKGRQ